MNIQPSKQLVLNIRPEQTPSLENFVVGSNQELLNTLHSLAKTETSSVYVWGGNGSGRTHLLQGVIAQSSRPVHCVDGSTFSGDFYAEPNMLLVVDNVEALSPEAQIALFRCFNDRLPKQLQIVLSGSTAPLSLPCREDLRTRIGQSLIYEVKPLTDSEKASALLYHAAQRGMRIDDHIIEYLLRHGRRDLPSLMAVLNALDQQSLEQQRPVTLPLLREILQPRLEYTSQ